MRPPGFRTLLLGSRFTAPPILLGSAWYIWQWWQAGGQDNTGLIAIALFLFSGRALSRVLAYRQWRADWRAMGPDQPAKPRWLTPRRLVGILGMVAIGCVVYWASQPEAPPALRAGLEPAAMGSAALSVMALLMRALMRLRRHRQRDKLPLVAVAVRSPVHRLPGIRGCYRRLPPYCKELLRQGGN